MLKMIARKIERRLANRSWENKWKYLLDNGAQLGGGTILNCGVEAFGTEPYLIKCGKNCLFAGEIHLLTHDGGVWVLNNLGYFGGEQCDSIAPIVIGDNVYIGFGAYIMPGVSIGDNSIIGANAVVTRDVPANSVVAGIPAHVIETVDEYYKHLISKNRIYPTASMSQAEKREYFSKMSFDGADSEHEVCKHNE